MTKPVPKDILLVGGVGAYFDSLINSYMQSFVAASGSKKTLLVAHDELLLLQHNTPTTPIRPGDLPTSVTPISLNDIEALYDGDHDGLTKYLSKYDNAIMFFSIDAYNAKKKLSMYIMRKAWLSRLCTRIVVVCRDPLYLPVDVRKYLMEHGCQVLVDHIVSYSQSKLDKIASALLKDVSEPVFECIFNLGVYGTTYIEGGEFIRFYPKKINIAKVVSADGSLAMPILTIKEGESWMDSSISNDQLFHIDGITDELTGSAACGDAVTEYLRENPEEEMGVKVHEEEIVATPTVVEIPSEMHLGEIMRLCEKLICSDAPEEKKDNTTLVLAPLLQMGRVFAEVKKLYPKMVGTFDWKTVSLQEMMDATKRWDDMTTAVNGEPDVNLLSIRGYLLEVKMGLRRL